MEPTSPFVHAATFVMAGSASGEEHRVRIAVPFNFLVGGQILPSGDYVIASRRRTPELLEIRNWEKSVNTTARGESRPRGELNTDQLIFHKYRSLYFLTDIQFANSPVNIHFPTTQAETWIQTQAEQAGHSPVDAVKVELTEDDRRQRKSAQAPGWGDLRGGGGTGSGFASV